MGTTDAMIIRIDRDLEDIVPGYLENRKKDIEHLLHALGADDYDSLRILGHRMKGSGSGYGFDLVSAIGQSIEAAATTRDRNVIEQNITNLASYLDRVNVVYE